METDRPIWETHIADWIQAKEVFFYCCCNHFSISRELPASEYRNFLEFARDEDDWRREFIEYWTTQLSLEDLRPAMRLARAVAWEALPALIAKASEGGDSFARFWYAFYIWDIAKTQLPRNPSAPDRENTALCQSAKQAAIGLWQSVLNEPIRLSDDHRAKISKLLPELAHSKWHPRTPEEYLLDYSRNMLAQVQAFGAANTNQLNAS